jgi:hypothetical protein
MTCQTCHTSRCDLVRCRYHRRTPGEIERHRLNRRALPERAGRYGQDCNGGRSGAVSGSHGPCGEVRQELAVYVLGAIAPADRSDVDRHLADCAGCRDALAELAGLPGLLRRVSVPEAVALAGPGASSPRENLTSDPALRSLLRGASRNRRRHVRTRVAIAAVAGLVASAGVSTGWQRAHPAAERPAASAPAWAAPVRAANPRTGVSATVKYATRPWGLQLSVQVTGIPAGTTCELDVISQQGQVTTAGGWTIASGRANWYPASSSVALADVRGFAVTSGVRILVAVPIETRGEVSATTRPGRSW